MSGSTVGISKMLIYNINVKCSNVLCILDILYCYLVSFVINNLPPNVNIQFSFLVLFVKSAY